MKEISQHAWLQAKGLRKFIFISLGLLVVAEIFGIYIPYLFGTLINGIQGNDNTNVMYCAILAITAMVSSHCIMWIREYLDLKRYFFTFGEKIERNASSRLMMLSLGQHMNMNSSVTQETINVGVSAVKEFVANILFNLLPQVLYVVISLVAISLMSWPLGLTVAVLSVLYLFLSIRFNKLYESRLLSLEGEQRKRGKFKAEMLRNVISVKFAAQEDWFTEKYNKEIARVNNITRSLWIKYTFGTTLIGLLRVSIIAVTLLLGINLVRSGHETAGTFVMFFSWTGGITNRLGNIRGILKGIAQGLPSIKKYLDLIKQEPTLQETGVRETIPYGKVVFDNVSYAYPQSNKSEERGIQNVSFEAAPGEMIGIVGESGAGKSTLIKLLMRGWDPTSGGIYIDNLPLTDFSRKFRRDIVYVEQEGQLFDDTVRFNLTFGLDGTVTDEALWETLEETQVASRIRGSEQGLESLVGERGIRFSGGERQRLLMARAMIRKAKILILDEATSHLDVNTEEGIFQNAIMKASRNTTTFIVAHRFATLKSCDRIIVMHDGKLVAFDTHRELMNSCKIYQKLVNKQNVTVLN